MTSRAHKNLRNDVAGTGGTEARRHGENQTINGWTYRDILELTKQGQAAKRSGRPNSFLMDLVEGRRALPPEMADSPQLVRQRRHQARQREKSIA